MHLSNKFIDSKTIHRFLRQELEISPDTRKVELRKCYVIKIYLLFTMTYRPKTIDIPKTYDYVTHSRFRRLKECIT